MEKEFCYGCDFEMHECYRWQNKKGYSAGLDWSEAWGCDGEHCFFFVIENKTGELVVF